MKILAHNDGENPPQIFNKEIYQLLEEGLQPIIEDKNEAIMQYTSLSLKINVKIGNHLVTIFFNTSENNSLISIRTIKKLKLHIKPRSKITLTITNRKKIICNTMVNNL